MGLISGQETKIPHAVRCSKKKKKDKHVTVHRSYCENFGKNKGFEGKRLSAFTLYIYKIASLLPPFYNPLTLNTLIREVEIQLSYVPIREQS